MGAFLPHQKGLLYLASLSALKTPHKGHPDLRDALTQRLTVDLP